MYGIVFTNLTYIITFKLFIVSKFINTQKYYVACVERAELLVVDEIGWHLSAHSQTEIHNFAGSKIGMQVLTYGIIVF